MEDNNSFMQMSQIGILKSILRKKISIRSKNQIIGVLSFKGFFLSFSEKLLKR